LNTGCKIYASIIKNKLTKFYENLIGEEQNGFRKRRSCSDGYFSLKLIIEKHRVQYRNSPGLYGLQKDI
jgi:hypothetical protein